jgi:hypothetical protein
VDAPTNFNSLPAQTQSQLDSIGRAIDQAQQQLRSGTVDPKLLSDLGMSQQQFQSFVEQYADKFGQVRQMQSQTQRPQDEAAGNVQIGQSGVQQGRSDGSTGGATGAEKLTPDEIKRLNESRVNSVSPEFRNQVEAYFRAISEGGATSQPAK